MRINDVIERTFKKLRRVIPSPSTLLLLLLWLGLSVITSHIVGTFLIPSLETPSRVLGAALGLTIGIPLLIAPRPTWELPAWGIGLNLLALFVFAVMARPTSRTLEQHGDWVVSWLEQRQEPHFALEAARKVKVFSQWMISQVPIDEIERQFGLSENASYDDYKEGLLEIGRDLTGTEPGDGRPEVQLESGKSPLEEVKTKLEAEVARRQNDEYYRTQIQSPDARKVDALERRLANVINLERTRRGLPSLTTREDLSRVARAHSEAMRDRGFFSHRDPDGHGPEDRARAALLANPDVEENIGKVVNRGDVPRDLVNGFLTTPADRERMLNREKEYQAIGVGIACEGATCYGTVLFL